MEKCYWTGLGMRKGGKQPVNSFPYYDAAEVDQRIEQLEQRLKLPDDSPFEEGYDAIDLMNDREKIYKQRIEQLEQELNKWRIIIKEQARKVK